MSSKYGHWFRKIWKCAIENLTWGKRSNFQYRKLPNFEEILQKSNLTLTALWIFYIFYYKFLCKIFFVCFIFTRIYFLFHLVMSLIFIYFCLNEIVTFNYSLMKLQFFYLKIFFKFFFTSQYIGLLFLQSKFV